MNVLIVLVLIIDHMYYSVIDTFDATITAMVAGGICDEFIYAE